MRTKKAFINSSINVISFIITFIPNLIVRKILLDTLGNDILGLNSLYTNIIGWLSIVEMGVGTAIIFSLYKPYSQNDKRKINSYIRFYGKFYRCIGIVIFILGICILPFLKFFVKGEFDSNILSIGFILFLINSVFTYMFSHKLSILNVAQEAYKITICTTISKLLVVIFQIAVLKNYPNFIIFIIVQVIINLIYYLVINLYILKKYPWLNGEKEELNKIEKESMFKNVKAMFIHKIGNLVVNSTDNIIISSFIGLSSLANYSNYQMVISALRTVISTGLTGITASIGNMLTDGDSKKACEIHKKIFFATFWIVSFITISLYNTLNQFIGIWMGDIYILDKLTFNIILINMYFSSMRSTIDEFQSASGNFYQDRYAAFAESIINLIFSLLLVKKIGIAGVLLGTLISNLLVIFWTKPYIVYKYVFKSKLKDYFKMYFKYLSVGFIPLIITNYITKSFKLDYNLSSFIINCGLNILIINIIYVIIFFRTEEFKYYVNFIKNMRK